MNKRYKYGGDSILRLTSSQKAAKASVEKKVDSGEYTFESVDCISCGGNHLARLAERDRYGLKYHVKICENCGLTFTSPRMSQESYKSFYENEYRHLYNDGTKNLNTFFFNQYRKTTHIASFLSQNGVRPDGLSILEVGCGAGGILQYFKDRGAKVTGLDLNDHYLEYGRSKGLNLQHGFITDLGTEEKYDMVIYNHVMEHILDPVEELRAVADRLVPAGLIYIEVPGIKALKSYHYDFLRYLQNAHVFHFSSNTLINILEQAGFEVISANDSVRVIARWKSGNPENAGKRDVTESDYDSCLRYLKSAEKKRRTTGRILKVKNQALHMAITVLDFFGIRKLYRRQS